MISRALVCIGLVLPAAGMCESAAAAPGRGPEISWTGDFFLIRFHSDQGTLVIQGRQMPEGLEASASLGNGGLRQVTLISGRLTVRTENGGEVSLTAAPDDSGLRLLSCDLHGEVPGRSALDRALAGLQQALFSNPGWGGDQTLADGLTSALLLAPQFGYEAGRGDTSGKSLADCMRQKRDCRSECEKEYCWYDDCSTVALTVCYTLCDLEYMACGLRAIAEGSDSDVFLHFGTF